jgi:hypothetical protein
MKKLLIVILLISNFSHSQQRLNNLKYNDTKFSLCINIPFGVTTYLYNVRNEWGGFISVLYAGNPGINDDNYISQWHELTDDYQVNYRGGSFGIMRRIWKPIHIYGGVGLAWGTRQLIYKDTPPVVLDDAYRTSFSGVRPMIHGGIHFTWWRIALGAGLNSYYKGPEFSFGYVIKFLSESK